MFWTDWGKHIIGKAGMDGSNPKAFISSNIDYPNGIAIDYHNSRLYWVDAKLAVIESVKLDGSDRRVRKILKIINIACYDRVSTFKTKIDLNFIICRIG